MNRPDRSTLKRVGLGAVSLGIIVATFAFVLPKIADYRDVWGGGQDISWPWFLRFRRNALNLRRRAACMVALPGLSFASALDITQASTALLDRRAGRRRHGIAGSFAIFRAWGFTADVALR